MRILSNISQLQFKNGIQRGGWSKRSLLSGLEQNSDFDPNLSGNGSDDVSEIMAYAQEKFEGKPPHFLRSRQLLMNSHQVTLDNNFPLIMNLYLKLYEAQPEAFQSSPILRSSFNNGLQFFHRTQYTRDSGDHPSWRGSFPQVVTNQELNTYERRPTFNDHSALNVLDLSLIHI